MNNKIIVASILSALAMSAVPAFAQDASNEGRVFVRGEIGKSKADGSKRDTSYGLHGGYYFNRNFGVEGFYSRLYNQSETYQLVPNVTGKSSASVSALGAGVIGKYNFADSDTGFFVSGRAGIARMRGTASWNEPAFTDPALGAVVATSGSTSATSTRPYFGIGAGYDFTPDMGVSLNVDQYRGAFGSGKDADKYKINNVSLGFEYRF